MKDRIVSNDAGHHLTVSEMPLCDIVRILERAADERIWRLYQGSDRAGFLERLRIELVARELQR